MDLSLNNKKTYAEQTNPVSQKNLKSGTSYFMQLAIIYMQIIDSYPQNKTSEWIKKTTAG